MASKTKETFTVIVSMVLVALLSYSIIHVYRYYIHYGGLLAAPADVYLPFLYKVFPSFFVLFLATVILLATRSSDRQRPTASAAPAETEQNHTYSLDIFGADLEKRSETPAAQAEVPQESTPSGDEPYSEDLSSDELDFFNAPQVFSENEPTSPEEPLQSPAEVHENTQQSDAPQKRQQVYASVLTASEEATPLEKDDFYTRFREEVTFSNEKRYEISMILLNIEPKKFSSDFMVFKETIESFFSETAFVFDYPYKNTFAVVLPFFSFSETEQELTRLYDQMKSDLKQRSTAFRAGFTGKFSRLVDSETILYETEVAFKKALEDDRFCILGFEPDVNKYEQYYSS
ncbi:MAG: hypothetical protein K9M84_02560 [Spirochaetia bacterium]|nr:hypothetical protein [Spirochaetia bacterium]MCF7940470.1 hypothetical protein [Spirochaetia bacterium]